MSRLIAIDPATKKLGYAVFDKGVLEETGTLEAYDKNRLNRSMELISRIALIIREVRYSIIDSEDSIKTVVIEDPMLRGKANTTMQRFIGALEFSILDNAPASIFFKSIHYIRPTTVKRAMGHGRYDKLEVALGAGELLTTDKEKEILADAVDREAWDETDAVAIGLTYIKGLYETA